MGKDDAGVPDGRCSDGSGEAGPEKMAKVVVVVGAADGDAVGQAGEEASVMWLRLSRLAKIRLAGEGVGMLLVGVSRSVVRAWKAKVGNPVVSSGQVEVVVEEEETLELA